MKNISLNSVILEKLNHTTFITTALPYVNGQLHIGHLFKVEHIAQQYEKNLAQYKEFYISFDVFGQTHDSSHTEICQHLFKKLYDSGRIYKDITTSWFDKDANQFLKIRI